jgi:hypothetical protein
MRLTKEGIEKFSAFILSHKSDEPLGFPKEILLEGVYAEAIGGSAAMLDEFDASDRMQAAKCLYELVQSLGLKDAEKDAGFWTWCSAYLYDRLRKGKRKVGDTAVWVLMPEKHDRYYRHYLASIWSIYAMYPDSKGVLEPLFMGRPVNTPGELFEQFASRQERITNESVLRVLYRLYWDKKRQALKTGAGGKSKGSARRLAQVLKQYNRTYDLFELPDEELFEMLPVEFDKYRDAA